MGWGPPAGFARGRGGNGPPRLGDKYGHTPSYPHFEGNKIPLRNLGMTARWRYLFISLSVLILDQATKAWILVTIPEGQERPVTSWFMLTHWRNPGVSSVFSEPFHPKWGWRSSWCSPWRVWCSSSGSSPNRSGAWNSCCWRRSLGSLGQRGGSSAVRSRHRFPLLPPAGRTGVALVQRGRRLPVHGHPGPAGPDLAPPHSGG